MLFDDRFECIRIGFKDHVTKICYGVNKKACDFCNKRKGFNWVCMMTGYTVCSDECLEKARKDKK